MARVVLNPGDDIIIGSDATVYGTVGGSETVTIIGGNVTLDASFNAGGDTIELPGDSSDYTGRVVGSSMVLTNGTVTIRIPVGVEGLDVVFDDGRLELVYDEESESVLLGDQDFDTGSEPVGGGNEAPAVNRSIPNQDAVEGERWSYRLAANAFTDPDGDTLTYSARLSDGAALPSWLNFDAATLTFSGRPPSGFTGSLNITVTASDGEESASDTFRLRVESGNDAPGVAVPIADQAIDEDEAWSFTLPEGTFSDADGDTLTYSATLSGGAALPGWLAFDASTRTFSGTPPQDSNGEIELTVTAGDGALSVSDSFILTIDPVNDAPLVTEAIEDQQTGEDEAWSFTVPVSAFGDADADTLSYSATLAGGDPLPGWLSFDEETRTFSGTPPQDYNGAIDLTVTASDGEEAASGTFTLTIGGANDAPVVDNAITDQDSDEDTAWSFTVPADAFADVDGDTLTYTATLAGGGALPGWLSFNASTRTFSGTPPQDYNGAIDLTVTASDGEEEVSDSFTLTVDPANDAPVVDSAIPNQGSDEDTAWSFTVPAGTFEDVDGDTLTYTATLAGGDPLPGWLDFDAGTRTFSGTPPQDFNGAIDLTVTASDGTASVSGTFTLTIGGANDAPVAVANNYTATEDATLIVSAGGGLLANDTDADGDTLTAVLVTGPSHGTLTLNANGSFTYVPAANYQGTDSFTYRPNDGTANGNIVTVNLTVTAVNDAPFTADDSYTVSEDGTLTVAAGAGVLANDTDAEGNSLTAELVADTAHGSLTFNANGSFTYVPDADYNGTDSFTYRADDGTASGNVATVTLNVTAVNDAPVANADNYTVAEDGTLTVPAGSGLLVNDADVEGSPLSAVLVTGPANGTLTLNANGSFTYVPTANYEGTDSFTYRANDGTASGNTVTVSLDVTAVNDAPELDEAIADQGADEGEAFSFTVPAGAFSDADGDTLTYSATLANGDPLPDWLDFDPATRTFSGTPDDGDVGEIEVEVTADDGHGGTASGSFTLTIEAAPIPATVGFTAGAYMPLGDEILVNTATQSDQYSPQITSLEGGGFVVTWWDFSLGAGGATGDASGTAVKAQVFDADGDPVGSEILVNTATQNEQYNSQITALEGGGFVVTWQDGSQGVGGATGDASGYAVKAQVFDADGGPVGTEILVNTATQNEQGSPRITALEGGGFVVTWQDWSAGVGGATGDASSNAVKAQVFDADGDPVGTEILVNTATQSIQTNQQITALEGGGFVVTWQDHSQGEGGATGDASTTAVKAQVFDADGDLVGIEILVNTATQGTQATPQITSLEGGGFVVTWWDSSLGAGGATGDASGYAVKAQVFDANGDPAGTEIRVNTATQNNQYYQQITSLEGGGFVVTWMDYSQGIGGATGDASNTAVKAQVFDADGDPVGTEILVNTAIQSDQYSPQITALEGGGFVVTWYDYSQGIGGATGDASGYAIKAQVFDADGDPAGTEIRVNTAIQGNQVNPQITALEGGGFVVTWQDYSQGIGGATGDASSYAVKAQIFGPAFQAVEQEAIDLAGIIAVDDPDAAGGDLTVTLSVDYGVLDIDAGSTGAEVDDSGTDEVTITGTLAEIQALLAGEDGASLSFTIDDDTPPAEAVLTVSVDDGSAVSVGNLEIPIVAVNDAPELDEAIADQGADEGEAFSFTVPAGAFSDADGDTLTYSATLANGDPLPDWLDFDPATRTFSGTPDDGDVGEIEVEVTADDGHGGTASGSFTLTIEAAPIPATVGFTAGAYMPLGTEILVNTATQSDQGGPQITSLEGGGFVVTWHDYSQGAGGAAGDASSAAVKAQVFDADGDPVGTEILVNTATQSYQEAPQITSLEGGGFVVTWRDSSLGIGGATGDASSYAVKAQVFDADGLPLGTEILVNTATQGIQTNQQITALEGGGFVVTWQDLSAGVGGADGDASGTAVKAQVFDGDGLPLGTEILVNTATQNGQSSPQITALEGGGFVVTWEDGSLGAGGATGDASSTAVKAQVFDADGDPVGIEILVNTATNSNQYSPQITALEGGGFVVTWQDYSRGSGGATGDASGVAVKAQVFEADGDLAGTEILVNTATQSDQYYPQVTSLEGGGFVVTWYDYSLGVGGAIGDASNLAVKAQVFDADGAPVGSEILVNTATQGTQANQQITALEGGGFVVTWQDASLGVGGADGDASGTAVKAQVFDGDGLPLGTEILVNTATQSNQANPQITALEGGAFVVTWQDYSQGAGGATGDASGYAVKAQIFGPAFQAVEQEALDLAGIVAIDDPDAAGGDLTVTLSVDYGVLDVDAGSTGAEVEDSGTGEVTVTGTLAEIQALLAGENGASISFTADAGTPSAEAVLTVSVDDGTAVSVGNLEIPILPANEAPELAFAVSPGNPVGPDVLVNMVTAGSQEYSSITALADGGYVVAWHGLGDGSGAGIYTRLYDETGAASGGDVRVNSTVTGDQRYPAIAALAGGGYVVTWIGASDGSGAGIHARLYDETGAAQGPDMLVNSVTTGDQVYPSVAALADGGYVVTWQSNDGGGWGVHVRRFDEAGVAQQADVLVNSVTTGDQTYPSVAALADGGYVVTWYGNGTGDNVGIYARRYDETAATTGPDILVNSITSGDQYLPSAAAMADGGYLVTWYSYNGSDYDIYARRFDEDGVAQGADMLLNTLAGPQYYPFVTVLADGGYVVAWMGNDGDGYGIHARRFDEEGVAQGPETLVNGITAGSQYNPSIAALADGDYVVNWYGGNDGDGFGIYARRFTDDPVATEQVPLDLTGVILVDDTDAGTDEITLILELDYGLIDANAGTTGAEVDDSGTDEVTITGTLAEIQALLAGEDGASLTFLADTDTPPGEAELTVSVDDGSSVTVGNLEISIVAVPDL